MKRISGLFFLSGEQAKFTLLKKALGKAFKVNNEVGSYLVTENYKTLDRLLDILIEIYPILQKSKIDKIEILINLAYESQCNWEVSTEQVNKLRFLNASLSITAYKEID